MEGEKVPFSPISGCWNEWKGGSGDTMEVQELLPSLVRMGLGLGDPPEGCGEALSALTPDQWEQVWDWSSRQQLWGVVGEGLRKVPQVSLPPRIKEKFCLRENELALQYYGILSFSTYLLDLLGGQRPYLLKGVALSTLYPREEMRKIGDVDLYIQSPEDREKAFALLEQEGFEANGGIWDYHLAYYKNWGGKRFCLELHSRPAGRMSVRREKELELCRRFSQLKEREIYRPAGQEIPCLPATWFAFQLLLHTMNHFLAGEFQLSMLCDWTLFWEKKGGQVDRLLFLELLKESGGEQLARMMTGISVDHLGLSSRQAAWLLPGRELKEKQEKIFRRLMMGTRAEENRLALLLDPDKPLAAQMVGEVHRQMKYRFPRAGRWPVLWPVLWCAALALFFYNNITLHRGSLTSLLAGGRHRGRRLEELGLKE